MTTIQQRAAEAIKSATGWDAGPTQAGAIARRPTVQLHVWQESPDRWICGIHPSNTESWPGTGPTPEAAIAAVLPRYRAHIAALAADILPWWPRLEWQRSTYMWSLVLVVGNARHCVLDVEHDAAFPLTIDGRVCLENTRETVWARVKTHVQSLALPCPLPPFPGASDAS
jgi:hypothetical protein